MPVAAAQGARSVGPVAARSWVLGWSGVGFVPVPVPVPVLASAFGPGAALAPGAGFVAPAPVPAPAPASRWSRVALSRVNASVPNPSWSYPPLLGP
ncbi:hypothetical protein Saa2_08555 [Streptomyces acidiscabies]|nr:hypothetical protein Saa2_08555 [Streptomyces acidiscabies]